MKEKGPRGIVPSVHFGIRDEAYNKFLEELNPKGNEAVQLALASTNDERFIGFCNRLSDPAFRTYSLAALAKSCNIGLPEFGEWWRDAQKARTMAIATSAVVDLAKDLASDVRTKKVYCDRCDGLGVIWAEAFTDGAEPLQSLDPEEKRWIRKCPACKGEREVDKIGDAEARRFLLEMTGYTGKGNKGVAVQINNYGGAGMDSAVERLNRVNFTIDVENEAT